MSFWFQITKIEYHRKEIFPQHMLYLGKICVDILSLYTTECRICICDVQGNILFFLYLLQFSWYVSNFKFFRVWNQEPSCHSTIIIHNQCLGLVLWSISHAIFSKILPTHDSFNDVKNISLTTTEGNLGLVSGTVMFLSKYNWVDKGFVRSEFGLC
jgi:hypothetical protein